MPKKTTSKTASKTPLATTQRKQINLSRNQLILTIVIVVIVLLYYFKGLFIAAVVNGQPISRLSVVEQLEQTKGKQTLNGLVTKALILQEADKRHISVSDKDTDQEISKIQKNVASQGENLDQLLTAQGLTQAEFRDQVKTQKIVEKMFAKDITVSNSEIDQFIKQNQQTLPPGQSQATLREGAKLQIQQKKLSDKFQALIADLKNKAKITYFVNY